MHLNVWKQRPYFFERISQISSVIPAPVRHERVAVEEPAVHNLLNGGDPPNTQIQLGDDGIIVFVGAPFGIQNQQQERDIKLQETMIDGVWKCHRQPKKG